MAAAPRPDAGVAASAAKALGLAGATAVAAAVGWTMLSPTPCHAHARCAELDGATNRGFHEKIAMGLGVLLVREAAGLLAVAADSRGEGKPRKQKRPRWLAPLLLCLVLTVLVSFELGFVFSGSSPWAHTAHGRPVHTLRYVEWLLSVPLLILLSAYCVLGRPIGEVLPPLILTEVYIIVAWLALVVQSTAVAMSAVVVTFVLYAWASFGMLGWVLNFLRETPPDAPCRWLRVSSELLLVVLFAFYAAIYLLAVFDVIPPVWEEMGYAWFGFGCKVLMSMIFTAVRLSEHSQELGALVSSVTSLSSAFMSLLRSNFDFVVPCVADSSGVCRLPESRLADLAELGRCLRRPVIGETLNDLLAGSADKQRFATYVQNALRRATSGHGDGAAQAEGPWGSHGAAPPLAQVLHIKLECLPEGEEDAECAEVVSAVVHFSVVPQQGMAPPDAAGQARRCQHVVVGLRLNSEDAAAAGEWAPEAVAPMPMPVPKAGPGSSQSTRDWTGASEELDTTEAQQQCELLSSADTTSTRVSTQPKSASLQPVPKHQAAPSPRPIVAPDRASGLVRRKIAKRAGEAASAAAAGFMSGAPMTKAGHAGRKSKHEDRVRRHSPDDAEAEKAALPATSSPKMAPDIQSPSPQARDAGA